MTEFRSPNFPSSNPESSTQPRYSLAYPLIGSTDTILRHVSGSVRVVEYEQTTPQKIAIRDALIQKGLILGSALTGSHEKTQTFRVPKSARPIGYDSRVKAPGAFSYNDEQLFFDLGNMLGELFTATDSQTVLTGNIGRAVAFVEFTEPNTRQLFFVPGVEKLAESLPHGSNPLGFYAGQLIHGFGHRFDESSFAFRMGFAEATAPRGDD